MNSWGLGGRTEPRSCDDPQVVAETARMVGNVLGWVSSCLYVGARIPQIRKNYLRKSTEGISGTMFYFAVMGNFTYSTGILLRGDRLVKAAPWLAGSLSAMSLDIFLVWQSRHYAKSEQAAYVPLVSAEEREEEQEQAVMART